METTKRDPLLLAAKVLLAFVMGVCTLIAIVMLIMAIAVPFAQGELVAELIAEGKGPVPDGFFWAVSIMLLGVTALLGMLVYFLLLLWRVIGSVGEGDPFVPENADRLSRMGWVALAGYVLAFMMGGLVTWIANIAQDLSEDVHLDGDVDVGGGSLLMILILFILARVFRKGTEMRAELEGTV